MQKLKNIKRNIKQYIGILSPISNAFEKFKNRHKCYYNGTRSITKDTIFEGHNMIAHDVTLKNCYIGEASYINHNSRLIGCKIGKFCSIADNVYSGFGHHPLNCISTHSSFFYDTSSQLGWTWFADNSAPKYDAYKHPKDEKYFISEIANDVWIGSHVLIMDGIKIGTGAVIGAGSVVTKDVPPYAIVAGIPAKIIRYRHSDKDIDCLLKYEWWNMGFNKLKNDFRKISINGIDFNTNPKK